MISDGTLYEWRVATGIPEQTIQKRLLAIGVRGGPMKKYTAQEIIEALFLNPEREEKLRKLRLENEAAEREALKEEAKLLDIAQVERAVWFNYGLPLKQELESMPAKLGPRVRVDPEHAFEILTQWVEEVKRQIKTGAKGKSTPALKRKVKR